MSFCKDHSWSGINENSEILDDHMLCSLALCMIWEVGGVLEAGVQKWKQSWQIFNAKTLVDAIQQEQVQIPMLGKTKYLYMPSVWREWDTGLWGQSQLEWVACIILLWKKKAKKSKSILKQSLSIRDEETILFWLITSQLKESPIICSFLQESLDSRLLLWLFAERVIGVPENMTC